MKVDFEALTRLDSMPVLVVSRRGLIVAANEAARGLDLKSGDDLLERLDTSKEEALQFLNACAGSTEPHFGRLVFRLDAGLRSMRCDGALLRPAEAGQAPTIVLRCRTPEQAHGVFAALTEQVAELHAELHRRKRAEADLQRALREKDVLLREVQHRVRNNMQLIASMVELQARRSPDASEALSEVGSRVRTIALAQEQLYERERLGEVELAAYLRSLVSACKALRSDGVIEFSFVGEPATVGLDRAVPVGLIVNELLTNAAKHAFPGGRSGVVQVAIATEAGSLVVQVADDGVGLPEGGLPDKPGSLGFRLIRQLAAQADASIQIEGMSGVRVRIGLAAPGCGAQPSAAAE